LLIAFFLLIIGIFRASVLWLVSPVLIHKIRVVGEDMVLLELQPGVSWKNQQAGDSCDKATSLL